MLSFFPFTLFCLSTVGGSASWYTVHTSLILTRRLCPRYAVPLGGRRLAAYSLYGLRFALRRCRFYAFGLCRFLAYQFLCPLPRIHTCPLFRSSAAFRRAICSYFVLRCWPCLARCASSALHRLRLIRATLGLFLVRGSSLKVPSVLS